ncbi:MAG: hypothetical protein ACKVH8_08615 [Pirellulales bacterium]
MSKIKISCPCCGISLNADPQLSGSTVRCPKCLSPVPIKRKRQPEDSSLAQPVEASFNPRTTEEDLQTEKACLKCANVLQVHEKLCSKCGYHLVLETYFEDLSEESLQRRDTPKTKAEVWFEEQLYDYTSAAEVKLFSIIFLVFISLLFVVLGTVKFGSYSFFFSFPMVAGIWFSWYKAMQICGVLPDSNRERRLQKEQTSLSARQSPAPLQSNDHSLESQAMPAAPVSSESGSPEGDVQAVLVTTKPPLAKPAAASDSGKITEQGRGVPGKSTAAKKERPTNRPSKPKALPSDDEDDWLSDIV